MSVSVSILSVYTFVKVWDQINEESVASDTFSGFFKSCKQSPTWDSTSFTYIEIFIIVMYDFLF